MRWVPRLNEALDEGRFHLLWQPIGALDSRPPGHDRGRAHHYELLPSRREPGGWTLSPSVFLPAAERFNLSVKIDRWVISHALRWLSSHPKELENLHLCALNLSGRSLADSRFLSFVINEFNDTAVPPELICFDIAESTAIANLPATDRFVRVTVPLK